MTQEEQLKEWIPTFKAPTEDNPNWEASLPFRDITYQGSSKDQALSNLIFGVCVLGRKGYLDPNDPHGCGAPIVQHCLDLLIDELVAQLKLRREIIASAPQVVDSGIAIPAVGTVDSSALNRRSESITSIGTAIAALGRIKEL